MDRKTKKLFKNTWLFFLGNIGSKFIQFLLVPLYTYSLTTSEYGITDLIFTTINFLIPIFSIQITDSLLRFGLDKSVSKDEVINSALRVAFYSSVISVTLSPILLFYKVIADYFILFVIILNLRIYRDIFSVVLKIQDKNKLYAIDSIIYTFVLCIASYIFLVILKMGIIGYLLSFVVSNVFSIIFIIASSKLKIRNCKNNELLKKMISYSLPLIFNSISYWIIMASDRYMIDFMLSKEDVGLYGIATKIPTIITTFTSIFGQAWLISSISIYEDHEDTKYYSSAFKKYCAFSFILSSLLILIVKPFMHVYVSDNYYDAWRFVPLLIVSAIYSGLCTFLNSIYYAFKNNRIPTITTLVGAIINIILNVILIRNIGVMGAVIATLISWFVISFAKIVKIKDVIKYSFEKSKFYISSIIIVIECMIELLVKNNVFLYIINIILVITLIIINREIITDIVKTIRTMLFNKKVS